MLIRWPFSIVTYLCLMSLLGVFLSRGEEHHFLWSPQNTTVQLDNRFHFHCQVSGHQYGMIKWFQNGDEMPRQGRNYRIYRNGTLVFSKVKVVDRGWYHCKVGNGIMGTMVSEPGYLTVHAPVVIIKKHASKPREEPEGYVMYVSCHAAGIPPPVIEWRRNGNVILKNQTNPLENQTDTGTSTVSLSSRLRIIVSGSAIYSCSAVNFPLDALANVSEIFNVTRDSWTWPKLDIQFCAPYNGTTCKQYLQGRVVVHNGVNSLRERDTELADYLRELARVGLFSDAADDDDDNDNGDDDDQCEDPARRLLCHVAFPDCRNETLQAVSICQESCRAVKSVFCFRHMAKLDGMKLEVKLQKTIGLLNLPDCMLLPSKLDKSVDCVESDHHGYSPIKVRDDCYVEKGRWYNGTVNTTRSGHTCQSWLETSPHRHNRFPTIFPELLGAQNFCRNPGGEETQPWCYTTNAELRWEKCDVEQCKFDTSLDIYKNQDNKRDDDDEDKSMLYVIGACTLVTVCFILAICFFLLRRRKAALHRPPLQEEFNVSLENLPLNSAYHQMKSNRLNPRLETLEFPRNDIVFIEDIGHGAFGRVFKARIACSNHLTTINPGSKHSLTSSKTRNPLLRKDLKEMKVHASTKSCDSKLLEENITMLYDHKKSDRDTVYDDDQLVAVKMLKEDASDLIQGDFEREASLMVEFNHENVVRLIGVCTLGKPMCLLFEYMNNGDLNEYLRLCSPDRCLRRSFAGSNPSLQQTGSLTIADQLHIARQVACGMVYISERGYIHRDLATRNCLVGNNLIVKISDFGLARSVHSLDYYQGSDRDAIPVRWMPPEAVLYNKFSLQSDIWSFGVLLWEVFTFALQPYYGMTHEEVVNYLIAGNSLNPPENIPSAASELMVLCWHRKPSSRPSFITLHKSLTIVLDEVNKQMTRRVASVS